MHELSSFFKVMGGLIVLALAVLLAVFAAAHPWLLIVLLGAAALLAFLGFLYLVFVLVDLIGARRHRAQLRRLDVQAREDVLTGRQEERLRLQRADAEQFRLQWQAQEIVPLRRGEVLMHRRGDAFTLAYEPQPALAEPAFVEADPRDEDEPVQMLDAREVLHHGLPDGDAVVLGFGPDGRPVVRPWKKVKAVLILGLQGGGKTSTALWLLLQLVLKGGRLGLIDKHARSEEDSMYSRLRVLRAAFAIPVGDSPQTALRVIAHARQVLQQRLDGAHLDYPFLLVVDEFTAIMRQLKTEEQWAEVARQLAALVEDYNTEGRKHRCFAICIGQAANASRSGGSEVRDLFNTRLAHRMRAKQAQMLSLTEYQDEIAHLPTGQALVDMETDEPFLITIPYVTDEVLTLVANRLGEAQTSTTPLRASRSLAPSPAFTSRSLAVQAQALERSNEPVVNALPRTTERFSERLERVYALRQLNVGKQAIIQEIWQVKKGGSAGYKYACEEYERIIRVLVEAGKLEPQS